MSTAMRAFYYENTCPWGKCYFAMDGAASKTRLCDVGRSLRPYLKLLDTISRNRDACGPETGLRNRLSRWRHRLGDQVHQLVGADKQVTRELAVLQHIAIDEFALIAIELEAGQVLQP